MEKNQSEVTNKLRSAIKKKLLEINDFDNALPEYIMILIANQRSKAQMEKELSLFLRDDTINFTNWLWDLLNNLKSGSKSSLPKNDVNVNRKGEIETDEDAVVLDFDPEEREIDFLSHEDTNDSLKSKSSVHPPSIQERAPSVQEKEPIQKTLPVKSLNHKSLEKCESKSLKKRHKNTSGQFSKEPLSSAVVPVRKMKTDPEDEYDPAKPEYERTPNNVRNYGGPAALQANKLLLKAVDDATKSILKGKSIEDHYQPTPIKVLSSNQYQNPLVQKVDHIHQEKSSLFDEISYTEPMTDFPVDSEFQSLEYPPDIIMEDEDCDSSVSFPKSRTICLKQIPFISDSPEVANLDYFQPLGFKECVEEVRPKSPHFIVTLDGVRGIPLKRKFEDESDDSFDEKEYDTTFSDQTISSPEKKLKLNERCKYWPACKNSDNCIYHHPTVPCKCFPDCKFGDKCLYIHPNCKFDALCSRKDCPFTHASRRKLPLVAVPVRMLPVKSRKVMPVCKFYPQCTAKKCLFTHPKLCRYGTDCRLPACLFSHFPVPSRSQLKWQAAVS